MESQPQGEERQQPRHGGGSDWPRLADQRLDPFHKLGTRLIREHQAVWIEDLSGAGMAKNRKLARSIAATGWCPLRTLLASKARMDGPTVQAVSRWQPTSRTCPGCGHRDGKKDLSVCWWSCPACGAEQDRGGNAACTILPPLWGKGSTPVAPSGRPGCWHLAVRQEPI